MQNKIIYDYNHALSEKIKNSKQPVEEWYKEQSELSNQEFIEWLHKKE